MQGPDEIEIVKRIFNWLNCIQSCFGVDLGGLWVGMDPDPSHTRRVMCDLKPIIGNKSLSGKVN